MTNSLGLLTRCAAAKRASVCGLYTALAFFRLPFNNHPASPATKTIYLGYSPYYLLHVVLRLLAKQTYRDALLH